MKDVMNLTDLAVVALTLGTGVVGLVMSSTRRPHPNALARRDADHN
jgi:hypothetical protein